MLNETESLAFILAREGYDVWMTNSRGNAFSTEHIHEEYDSSSFYSKFWDFTFHEMAMYDFTANVFYIKNITGCEKLYYVGHSQGSVQYFIKYTQNPEFIEENIEKFVAIGTVVNVFNTVVIKLYIYYL
jgi:predicted alpha/beta hydrolase